MTQTNYLETSLADPAAQKLIRLTSLGIMLAILIIFSACAPTPTRTPVPTPTDDEPVVALDNENVQALNAAQAMLGELHFGLAPLLIEDQTRLLIETDAEGEAVKLAYPRQPEDPSAWAGMDSFVFAYALRNILLDSPQARRIAIGRLEVAAPVDDLQDRVSHYAVWIRFMDRSEAVVDLTPLGTNFAARHAASEFITQAEEIDRKYAEWREGVSFKRLQPMNLYYLLAKVEVFPDHYEFSLRAHLTQTATPIRPLQLTRGGMAKVEVKRTDFEAVRKLMLSAGPNVFNEQPGLITRVGANDPALTAVLDDHLNLLWHMVTKLEPSQQPGPVSTGAPPATATLTPTPTPTSTPTPTPTKPSLPLSTS
jgi:hypothetical protein